MFQGHLTWSRKKGSKNRNDIQWFILKSCPSWRYTKMKVTSFDLYAFPNAHRCRIGIKWREQEAVDGGEHFIFCGRKPEWCRWDCTMSALINRLKTACCAVGDVKEGRFGHIVAVIFGAVGQSDGWRRDVGLHADDDARLTRISRWWQRRQQRQHPSAGGRQMGEGRPNNRRAPGLPLSPQSLRFPGKTREILWRRLAF